MGPKAGMRSRLDGIADMSATRGCSEQTARELARLATMAPSPDNNQPWRMVLQGSGLVFFLEPQRALPSDVHGMFDLMAVGAAMENACLAAERLGLDWRLEVALGERAGRPQSHEPIGRLTWTEPAPGGAKTEAAEAEGLGAWIEQRQTSRQLYRPKALDISRLQRLSDAARPLADVELHWVVSRRAIRTMACLVAASDRLRLEQRQFHAELFRQLRWTAEEAERTGDGLDLRLLGLPPGGRLVLRAIRRWWLLSIANRLGASALLAAPAALSVLFSGAIGLLSVGQATSRAFLDAGRALQRVWLAATADGLRLQPLGSLPIFLAHVQQLGGAQLSRRQVARCQRIECKLQTVVPDLAGRTLVMALRIGEAEILSQLRSQRRPVEEVLRVGQASGIEATGPAVETGPTVATGPEAETRPKAAAGPAGPTGLVRAGAAGG
jgi:nitroreductase